MAQEEIDINNKPTKATKDIKKKKNASLEDMKKGWREKQLHGGYPLRTDNADVDKATTHQWLSSSSLKGETEGFILAAQDKSISTRESLTMVLILIAWYAQRERGNQSLFYNSREASDMFKKGILLW